MESKMSVELKNYTYYEEGLEYLKKTIEKQRAEINKMKERVQIADIAVREAEVSREAQILQVTKEKDELDRKIKKKSQRYKRKISEMLTELQSLT